MKQFKTTLWVLMLALAAVVATSCNTETHADNDGILYDIVTFQSQSEDGSVFVLQTGPSTPEILLSSTRQLDLEKVPLGSRVVIAYTTRNGLKPTVNSPIDLITLAQVHTADLIKAASGFESEMVSLTSTWLTGTWLNFDLNANVSEQPKKFELVVDESTLDQKMPTVYLLFESDDPRATQKHCYASFNVAWLWEDPRYDGFTLIVCNGNGPHKYEFKSRETIKPVG